MYIPDFKIEEFFSLEMVKREKAVVLWQLMDDRLLKTADALKKRYGTMVINNYLWEGYNHNRGYRNPKEMVGYLLQGGILKKWMASFNSQHCRGAALDATFKHHKAEEIRQDILRDPFHEDFKYITGLELQVSWLHIDVRNRDKKQYGILTF